MIDFIAAKTRFQTNNFRITDLNNKILVSDIDDYNKSLISMGLYEKHFVFKIVSENCYFRSTTQLFASSQQ